MTEQRMKEKADGIIDDAKHHFNDKYGITLSDEDFTVGDDGVELDLRDEDVSHYSEMRHDSMVDDVRKETDGINGSHIYLMIYTFFPYSNYGDDIQITINDVEFYEMDSVAVDGDASHEGYRAVMQVVNDEADDIERDGWPNLPFTYVVTDTDDEEEALEEAIDAYVEESGFMYHRPTDVDWEWERT